MSCYRENSFQAALIGIDWHRAGLEIVGRSPESIFNLNSHRQLVEQRSLSRPTDTMFDDVLELETCPSSCHHRIGRRSVTDYDDAELVVQDPAWRIELEYSISAGCGHAHQS